MPSICFYFQVHQPLRIKKYRFFDIGNDHEYFNDDSDTSLNNKRILERVARKSYLPANATLLHLLKTHPEFRCSFSLSGVFLEQIQKDFPEVLESFQQLVETGRVELLSETYYHSLSALYSPKEFVEQVHQHDALIKKLFGVKPKVFRNTELIYNNDIAAKVASMGFKGIITEGVDRILDWRSPNFLYRPQSVEGVKLLLKNYRLSDDIAFRFSEKTWKEHPLTAEKFVNWVNEHHGNGEVINLFMDYETFGEHQWEDTGIFQFLEALPRELLRHPDNDFVTPSEAIARYEARDVIDVPHTISWADEERDLSAWRSNAIQEEALKKVYSMEKKVLATKNRKIIRDWRRLQSSDHFYYMCTKFWSDGDVHKYFSPYESPYDAFIAFMNVLHDMEQRIEVCLAGLLQPKAMLLQETKI
ncbi:MAG: glycoside hydrolase family 57 protein [Candidatus Moraniibacteriota bacterium]